MRWAISLKKGHHELLITIDQIYQTIRSYPQTKPKLRRLQETLFTHLGCQDQGMFRQLSLNLSSDRQALKIIEFLEHNLKELKVRTLIFFDRYPADLSDQKEEGFAAQFVDFAKEITERLQLEEEYLIPLLERLRAQQTQ